MSQQQTSQSSGQGLLERVFKLREHGTTVRMTWWFVVLMQSVILRLMHHK